MRNKKAIAAKLAKELEATRALQPRLKREMYERQAKRASATARRQCMHELLYEIKEAMTA